MEHDIEKELCAILTKLIKEQQVTCFYVGHQGAFDKLVYRQLKKLQTTFPHISYSVVLAYLPKENHTAYSAKETIFPEGLESTPPKYAINKRNQWMIEHSDFVVTYIQYPFGGATKWEKNAIKKGLTICPLINKTQ